MAVNTEAERIRGINEPLPAGERVLWQGAPDWRTLAREALHVRKLALYFGVLLLWQVAASLAAGRTAGATVAAAAWLVGLGAVAFGLLAGYAWLAARTTIYAITTRRVVMRVGVAMPIFVNLPLTGIEGAALRLARGDCGDIPLSLADDVRLAYLHLWPHVRPWHVAHPQPMLRAVPDAGAVAALLAMELARTGGTRSAPALEPRPAARAHGGAELAA